MADYSELKRKAQEIRDEVKAGANTASRVGIAIEETVNALEAENVRAVAKEGSLQNDIQSINERIQDLGDIREGVGELQEDVTEQAEELNSLLTILEGKLDIKDLGSGLRPDQAVSEIISYVRTNNIKSALVFKYIDTDNSSTFGICISRIGVSGWILYLVARKGIEVLKYNSYGSRETWNEYGGVLRHDMNSVADEQLECLSIKGLKSVLTTKQDTLAPGDGITMADNVVSTLIGDGLAYNGREMVVSHDVTLKITGGKLGVNAGKGLYVNPDNKFGVHTGKGLAINHDDGTVEVAEEVFDEIEDKAPKVGYAPDLKVAYAEELVGRGESTPEVIGIIRPTSGKESSIKDGNATIERIKGESVVWNQLVSEIQQGSTAKAGTVYITPLRFEAETHKYLIDITLETDIPYNHIACLLWDGQANTNIGRIYGNNGRYKGIIAVEKKGSLFCNMSFTADTVDHAWRATRFVHDLTKMFNGVNVPTTIEDFEARKPLGVSNEYNEGTIVSFQGGDVKSVGFNAWDEEERTGNYDATTGSYRSQADRLCSKNPIKIIPNSVYFKNIIECGMYYDKDMNFIGYHGNVNTFTAPANAAYYNFNIPASYGTTYKNDICLHLVHSGYRNGDYEPYVDDIHSLPNIKKIKDNNADVLFPYGLLSAGSVHDEITATKAIKRVGVVDMGSLAWEYPYPSTIKEARFVIPLKAFPTIALGVADSQTNLITSIYTTTEKTGITLEDKTITTTTLSNECVVVRDSSYTDADTFKQALQGVLLYYELAESIEVDLEEPLNMTYEAWDFGTEELVAKGATTPLNADIAYLFNAVDRIRENSRHVEESEAKLTSMEQRIAQLETMIASLTNTANDE